MSAMDRRSFLRAGTAAGLGSLTSRDLLALDESTRLLEALAAASDAGALADFPLRAVPVERVDITDAFWRPRMEANRLTSLDHCFLRFEGDNGFSVSKLVEAAGYMLTERRDAALEAYVDGRIDGLVSSVDRRLAEPAQSVRVSGHFLEAAAAYSAATGKREILDAAVRAADLMDRVYGPGKQTYISGHQGLKIGLVALYRATGDERYWRLAKFFADERGKDDYERTGEYALDRTYAQDHLPVTQQTEAVGHCVRATFLYIAMTDIAALSGSTAYRRAVDAIWRDMIHRKTYVTGGIGSIRFHEQFGAPFELPNLSAWSETCAAYGSAVWNHRLFLLSQDARYIDVMERVLYNALLVGVSLSGDRFFYQNPLKSFGDYTRFEWINVPCCPPNVVRMVASIGQYIYATDGGRNVYVNLFVDSDAEVALANASMRLRQETRYPWDGSVRLHVVPETAADFTLHVRIPGWARGSVLPGDLYRFLDDDASQPALHVNGAPVPIRVENGYVRLDRAWREGDVIELQLPMPVRRIVAHPEVEDDRGRVALQRGPLVYCAEWPDNDGRALDIVVPDEARLESEFRSDLLGGVQVIRGDVQAITRLGDETQPVARRFTAIPYYAWANRGMGEMAVWLAREPAHAWLPPVLPPNTARVRTSGGVPKTWTGYNDQNDDLAAIHDGRDPIDSADQSHRFFRMRPPVGERAWLEYELERPTRISSSRVYWFDDRRFCRLPASWRLLYRDGDGWTPVAARASYDVVKDAFNDVTFDPITTTAVRLEVEPDTVEYRAGEIGPPAAMFISEDIAWREFGVIEWRVA